jgi:hypothetical protein
MLIKSTFCKKNFIVDALTTLLRTELTADFPSLVTPAISSADKDLLFDLAR